MIVTEFEFDLPEVLIAQQPPNQRVNSRLLVLDRTQAAVYHQRFLEIKNYLRAGDLLVFNNTKVMRARLLAHKSTGAKAELLIERILNPTQALVQIKTSKKVQPGMYFIVDQDFKIEVCSVGDGMFVTKWHGIDDVATALQRYGEIPLPPYIKRKPGEQDNARYQTVYAKHDGAVAAPTAGLHFDQELMDQLIQLGIEIAFVTLHVGAGTFKPVRVQEIHEHRMHSELAIIDEPTCHKINRAKTQGRRVIAIGTTSVRCLESAAVSNGTLAPFSGDTDIFIYPGYPFKIIDGLLTNFHLPRSTLLMLVCAFAGRETVLSAYCDAVQQRYRFFSYGDAMLII